VAAVISDFAQRHPLRDVRVSINDAGATPAVVSLRLDQAVETLLLEIHDEPDAALQLLRSRCARAHRRHWSTPVRSANSSARRGG
jgi:hypothetical protein